MLNFLTNRTYRECTEKIQLLKTPEERERRLKEIPNVHFDPKMNPDYESDDTEEYFNKEHGDHIESKYSGKNSRRPKKKQSRSRKDEKPNNQTTTTSSVIEEGSTIPNNQTTTTSSIAEEGSTIPNNQTTTTSSIVEEGSTIPNIQTTTTSSVVEEGSTIPMEKDAPASTLENCQHEADCNGSTITKLDHHATLSSSISNGALETAVSLKNTSYPNDTVWHYRDPNGKVQGPFSLVQLQRWSTTGYFSAEMRIWAKREDESLLLTDVLKQQFHDHENTTAAKKVVTQTEGVVVGGGIPSSTVTVTSTVPNLVNHDKLSDSQSFGQNWSANNNTNNLNYNPPSVESTVLLDTSSIPAQDTEKDEANIKHAPTAVIDLPGPTPKKMVDEHEKIQSAVESKALLQDSGNNPPSWSSASSLVVGGAKLPVSANGLGGCTSTPDKREEWDSGIVLEVAADHAATPTSNIDQNVNPSQPPCNDFTWHGVGEMIEFSTLAEESVSDLLAEVDAMESQYGLPSPTSRRNSFVDDLFNGSFDEFSPTPDQGTRSDGFSSSGDIQLPCQSTTTPDEHIVGCSQSNNINCAFDFMKTSNGLQQHSFISPEINGQTIDVSQKMNSGSMGFKWPEMERVPQGMIDINRSAKAEGDDVEIETKTCDVQFKVKLENGNHNVHQPIASLDIDRVHSLESAAKMKSSEHSKEMQAPKPIGIGAKLVTRVAQIKGLEGTTNQPQSMSPPPPPPPPLTLGLDPYDPCDLGSETMQGSMKFSSTGRPSQVTNTKTNTNINTNTGRSWNIGWDTNQQKYNSSNSPRERSQQIEESGHNSRNSRSSWNKHSSFGSDSSGGGGGNLRPPTKGQRVCRFYESGKCKKGASCKYLHPSQ
ncbi:hypothetical protein QVD17_18881 [Tagetes erecta]|uniref:Uncharacterized protein n=1 Tax=Tagetes erecta TaxID=13708 RepID=A0AAD8KIF9_TARER|nr:hypothetical protein QVD17_18881 [Tagetes erecta]